MDRQSRILGISGQRHFAPEGLAQSARGIECGSGAVRSETQKGACRLLFLWLIGDLGQAKLAGIQTLKLEPQPQVVEALGFLITNCAPSKSSL